MIIKLLGNKKDKDKGFYALMLNGSMFSNELNVFQGVDNKQFKALKKTKAKYKVLE